MHNCLRPLCLLFTCLQLIILLLTVHTCLFILSVHFICSFLKILLYFIFIFFLSIFICTFNISCILHMLQYGVKFFGDAFLMFVKCSYFSFVISLHYNNIAVLTKKEKQKQDLTKSCFCFVLYNIPCKRV